MFIRLGHMPPVVIDLRSVEDSRDVVHRAVQALAEGKLVAFPTETEYVVGASGLDETSVERLATAAWRDPGERLTLAVKSCDEAMDYAPRLSGLALRLARRCWPGPVTLALPNHDPDSLLRQLPARSRELIVPEEEMSLRVPGHRLMCDVLRMQAGPIAFAAVRGERPLAQTAQAVIAAAGEGVNLVLDDGPSRFGQPASTVRVRENSFELVRAGVVSEQTLKRLASFVVLFVCTGNTCRSPMAELICRQVLAERLKCPLNKLEDRGVLVMSAGLAAMPGGRASPEAVVVMSRQGLDLAGHESQPLTDQLAKQADVILTMTRAHREAIVNEWPQVADRVRVLRRDEGDVSDPIGGPLELYERCAAQMRAEIEKWTAEFTL